VRISRCDTCRTIVPFDAQTCAGCRSALGYLPDRCVVRTLDPTDDPAVFLIRGERLALWRCMNAAWGCNWMVPADAGEIWCRACRLTRNRPDAERTDAMAAWMVAESAKRRLVHQLDSLALPIEARSDGAPDGLAFDLVHLGAGDDAIGMATTGHAGGVVTLDLTESDDLHRAVVREQMAEHYRTVIGHLRHEIGHHFWNRLVGQSDHLAQFRKLFGDERADYAEALAAHHDRRSLGWDDEVFVTAYASAHPLEDWAETFAHYLHILDVVTTAESFATLDDGEPSPDPASWGLDIAAFDLGDLLARFRPINASLTELAACVGAPPPYPFDPTGRVVTKLEFVHRRVAAHADRDRFYASN
jgi:hypothetical protein